MYIFILKSLPEQIGQRVENVPTQLKAVVLYRWASKSLTYLWQFSLDPL